MISELQIVDNIQSTMSSVWCAGRHYETVPLRFINRGVIVKIWSKAADKERAMTKFKQVIVSSAAVAAVAILPFAPAMAGGHGYGYVHPWGLGRGIVGAAVALATLPLAIASAVVSSVAAPAAPAAAPYPAPGYAGGYAPAPYPVPPAYYAPRPAYYPAPRAYYAPRPYYAPYAGYAGRGYYRTGGSGYPRR